MKLFFRELMFSTHSRYAEQQYYHAAFPRRFLCWNCETEGPVKEQGNIPNHQDLTVLRLYGWVICYLNSDRASLIATCPHCSTASYDIVEWSDL